ncbi:MAG: hypothetical protein Kow0031_10770 [Anaerolineae bacterium]
MTKSRKLLLATGALLALCGVGYAIARVVVENSSPMPANLGVTSGQLAPCPETPNCVTSRATRADQAITPIIYSGTAEEAQARLLGVLQAMPRLTIITNQPGYIHAETRTAFWGFVDDNEFYFDDAAKIIEVRAAARLGQSDLGNNRARLEEIRAAFEAAP